MRLNNRSTKQVLCLVQLASYHSLEAFPRVLGATSAAKAELFSRSDRRSSRAGKLSAELEDYLGVDQAQVEVVGRYKNDESKSVGQINRLALENSFNSLEAISRIECVHENWIAQASLFWRRISYG